MSAGTFTRTRYESDTDLIHPIRVQPETLAATFATVPNAAPTGTPDSEISAQVTGSRRGLGLFARYITVVFTATPPVGYATGQSYKIPIMSQSLFAAVSVGATGEYLGVATQVISKTPERRR